MFEYLLFLLGFVILLFGAEYLVKGSAALAKKLGISPLIIGLSVIAFGTSMPEFFVNLTAALRGSADISLGNIIGSCISNILLIIGVVVLIRPIKIKQEVLWKDIPFSIFAGVMLFALFNKLFVPMKRFTLNRFDGAILLAFFVIFVMYLFVVARAQWKKSKAKGNSQPMAVNLEIHKKQDMSYTKIFSFIVLGSLGLYLGSKWVVNGAIQIALTFGLSEFLVSATIIAVGTSLPELVTTVIGAMKNEVQMVIGNLVGSNIFNIFLILGTSSMIYPIKSNSVVNFDIMLFLLSSILVFIFGLLSRKHIIKKWHGIIFLLMYFSYIIILITRG